MTLCMYRDIHTLQPYIIDFTQRGCHTLRQVLIICFINAVTVSIPLQFWYLYSGVKTWLHVTFIHSVMFLEKLVWK